MNESIKQLQDYLKQIESEILKTEDYLEKLRENAAMQRGAINALTELTENEQLQRELLPHLFDEKDGKKAGNK